MKKNNIILEKECWIVLSKDRKLIAKGVPGSRYLVEIDSDDNKRILIYHSKGMCKASFSGSNGFFHYLKLDGWKVALNKYFDKEIEEKPKLSDYLDAVKVKIIFEEIVETENGN